MNNVYTRVFMITTHRNTSIFVLEDITGTFDTIEHSTKVAHLFGDKDIGCLYFIVEKALSGLARSRSQTEGQDQV